MKRVAVLLSGQLRQWEIAVDNQKWFWDSLGDEYEIDYFIHTWNYSGDREGVSHEYEWRDVNKWEFNRICKAYDVKGSYFDKRLQNWFFDNDHWSALFYSYAQSVMLKKKYEMENNFTYDVVIKSRPDIVFNPKRTAYIELVNNEVQDNQLFTTHGGEMEHEFGMFNIDDCVFYCNSYTADILVNMYHYRQKLLDVRCFTPGTFIAKKGKEKLWIQQLGPGVLMHEFCREYGITPINTTCHRATWQPTLLKLNCPRDADLFKPKGFAKIEKHFRDFYTK